MRIAEVVRVSTARRAVETRLLRKVQDLRKSTVIIEVIAEDNEAEAIATGFDDYIAKPFKKQTVLHKLATKLASAI